MEKLETSSTALVMIDLQQPILGFAGGPHNASQVLQRAAALAHAVRAGGGTVVWVRVGWSDDYADAPNQPVDRPAALPPGGLPPSWWEQPAELGVAAGDLQIIKRQWGAFHGTELDLQLRRRGIRSIVLGGISTNIGVESTARAAWEHGYALLLAEDACSAASAEQHAFSMEHIMPRLGRVRSTAQLLAALAND